MKHDNAFVKNAADEKQVEAAGKRVKSLRDQQLSDLKAILKTEEGRRFLWRLLGHCKIFGTIWEASARIHYNSGMQDVGHFIQAEIVSAGEEYYFQMMTEHKGVKNV